MGLPHYLGVHQEWGQLLLRCKAGGDARCCVDKDVHTFNGSKHACCGWLGHSCLLCGHQARGRDSSLKSDLCIVVKYDGTLVGEMQIIVGKCLKRSVLWTMVPRWLPNFHRLSSLGKRAWCTIQVWGGPAPLHWAATWPYSLTLGAESAQLPRAQQDFFMTHKATWDPSNPSPCDCTCHTTYITQSVYSILICHYGSKISITCFLWFITHSQHDIWDWCNDLVLSWLMSVN